ncbi:diguanylate cyclase [Methylobacterium sp. NEAU 140]|uniref:PAS domain-containing protein n=1 Tax=Methylobacterium sp. NEAU 140 TaxID=3064945 RepID=UPI00273476D6|nr:PAS domain-containing protein [Methylobacterium sp. NEAU 140]MDP4027286.1 diguanylate cyclase [Methylobacterium sp. NEAU 140]
MAGDEDHQPTDAWEWRKGALTAAGVLGLWEWDHRQGTARYCPGAAGLLAGDPEMAWRDLTPADALTGVHADDAARLHARMGSAAGSDGIWVDECRVRLNGDGSRRVLCRGQTYRDEDGTPLRTMGMLIDITGGSTAEDQSSAGSDSDRAALERAAEYAVATYEAIQASGVAHLLAPARLLLLAVGREIARVLPTGHGRSH